MRYIVFIKVLDLIYKSYWITLTNFMLFSIVYLKNIIFIINFCRNQINVKLIYGGKCIALYETTRIKIRSKFEEMCIHVNESPSLISIFFIF